MKLFDESRGPIFKARIKVGAAIGQDHSFMRWPACFAPGGGVSVDPDMEFDAEDKGTHFDLRAPGFGILNVPGQYGNGSIYVRSINDLELAGPHRAAAIAIRREAKLKQIAEAEAGIAKLRSELDALV